MTYLRVLLISALTLALAAILFASSASAAGGTTLCKSNETPCSALNHYGVGAEFHALASGGITLVRTGSLINEQMNCGSSTFQGRQSSTGSSTTSVEAEVGFITFLECVNQSTKESCTNVALNQPIATITNTAGTMNGTFSLSEFSITSVCKGTPDCVFTSSSISLEMTGGEPATLVASDEKLNGSGVGCPKALDWTATYTLTSPTALWLAQSP